MRQRAAGVWSGCTQQRAVPVDGEDRAINASWAQAQATRKENPKE
jgi:hypothetical protein